MALEFTPREYQNLIVEHIKSTPRCMVWAGMGTGKTVSTLTALTDISLVENVFPVLIIAPLRVAETTWPSEIAKWNHTRHLKITVINGDKKDKLRALRSKADIFTINYESLPWLIEEIGDKWPFSTVVADESTKLKGFRLRQGTQRAKALARVAHTKIKRLVMLTGTPSPNGLQDLWGQSWFIDRGATLGRTFSEFTQKWFAPNPSGWGVVALPNAQKEIQDALKTYCITIEAADWFDLKAPIENPIYVSLPPKAASLYSKMEKEMFMELDTGHGIEALNAASKTVKCLQIANGAAYLSTLRDYETLHNAKLEALDDIIEEAAGAPILVSYTFNSDLDRLLKRYPEGRHLDKDSATIDAWNRGEIPLLFAHPASAGHGLNLQDGGNILVFFGVDWNLENHLQILERIGPVRQLQSGYNRAVFVHYILAKDTIDDVVLERLKSKRSVQDVLLEAMKKRNLN